MRAFRDEKRIGRPRLEEAARWEALVGRILEAAGPELARLRVRNTLSGQVGDWTRPLLPLAALLIVAFGSLLAWVGTAEADPVSGDPLLAGVLMPDPLVFWVEAGAGLTLDEIVLALERGDG